MGSNQLQTDAEEAPRAFVAIKSGDRAWVADLALGETVVGSGASAGLVIEVAGVAEQHVRVQWDGSQLSVSCGDDDEAPTFLNGKRLTGSSELKPGDEMALGSAQLVVGVSMSVNAGGRRALTHHEFRERLYEELARAGRGGRPAALLMLKARPGEGGRIATAALDAFRAGDVVGTYAHDELELLLPDTTRDVAKAVVERVLSATDITGVLGGLAVAPEDGDNPERLLRAARSALAAAQEQGDGIEAPPPRGRSKAEPQVGDPATRTLVAELEELAASGAHVLITGELSSGKALFARLLHERSDRRDGPMVVLPCASATADGLLRGRSPVAEAEGGTLLLDELGDLSSEAQAALLEQLDAAGSVRVVGTTHRALGGLVERNAFDGRLYGMLSANTVELPPLRGRPEDIIPLAERFAEEAGAPAPVQMSAGALARLRSYPWPGNVLEMRNAMERAVHLANGGEIVAEHLPSEVLPLGTGGEGRLREHVDSVERDAIVKALADSNHNQTHAAKRLGVSRRALIYKMEKYGLKPPPGAARKG